VNAARQTPPCGESRRGFIALGLARPRTDNGGGGREPGSFEGKPRPDASLCLPAGAGRLPILAPSAQAGEGGLTRTGPAAEMHGDATGGWTGRQRMMASTRRPLAGAPPLARMAADLAGTCCRRPVFRRPLAGCGPTVFGASVWTCGRDISEGGSDHWVVLPFSGPVPRPEGRGEGLMTSKPPARSPRRGACRRCSKSFAYQRWRPLGMTPPCSD
jgi:hypothetical protein